MLLESHRIELKSSLTDELEKEVIAFLNSNEGGEIYIGINDKGRVLGINNPDELMLNINNRLKSRISPSVLGLYDIQLKQVESAHVIKIILASGPEKPYHLISKGMSVRGCYLRVGTAAEPMEQRMIEQLFASRTRNSLHHIRSNKQDLSFEQLKIYYHENGLTLNEHFASTLELYTDDGYLNYVAYLMSDNNSTSIKVAKYEGLDRSNLIDCPEFGHCCLIKSVKQVLDYVQLNNPKKVKITGSTREEINGYHTISLREAILNAIVHNDYTNEIPPKFEFFSDRLEITSSGSLPQSLSQSEFFEGYSVPRNKEIMRIFKDIRLVEQLGSGIPRILNFYSKDCFQFTDHFIRMKFKSLLKSEVTTPHVTPHVTPHDGLVDGLVNGLVDGLVENQKKMIRLIKNKPTITIQELSQSIGISATAIDKNLMKLKEKKIIRRVGNNKNGGWVIVS